MSVKCILIILDGLGDRAHGVLSNQTPLQAAQTPVLDNLAALGANGLYHAALLGQALPSENAHFAMFGYEMKDFPGRAALEALGAGIELGPDDVAVLAHLASAHEHDNKLIVRKNKAAVKPSEAQSLVQTIDAYETNRIKFRFVPVTGVFGILILNGTVSPYITDTNLMLEGLALPAIKPWQSHTSDSAACNTARALTEYLSWAYKRLQAHPVNKTRLEQGKPPLNCPVMQRAGRLQNIRPFRQSYGLKGLSISSAIIYWGLTGYLGLDVKKVKDTRNPADDMAERLDMADQMLNDYDIIHVHTKAPDQAAHAKDPLAKKSVIEALDSGIGRVIDRFIGNPEVLLVVTTDHSTPSSGPLIHSGEPVPLTFCGPGIRCDTVQQFNEVSVANGALGLVKGKELIYLILNHLDRAKLQGIMDTPVDQPYYPGEYEPYKIDR